MKAPQGSLQLLWFMAVGGAVWLYARERYKLELAPAAGVRTFGDLVAQGVPLTRAVELPGEGGEICVFGDLEKVVWTLPSGPPAYRFDAGGRLLDFTYDVGDSTLFQDKYKVWTGTAVPMADLPPRFAAHPP